MTESIYKSIEKAKNGTDIPVFQSGKTMESRYNPVRDAENLCNSIDTNAGYFLVLGIGSGLFIEKLIEKYSGCFIVALEPEKTDIDFLSKIDRVKQLSKLTNVRLTTINELFDVITGTYLPAKYGDFKIIDQRAWVNENQNKLSVIQEQVNKAVGIISADYSVQAHFGKIWTKNILENAMLSEKLTKHFQLSDADKKKSAVILAAGPSLEKNLKDYSDKDKYFIISTDTAYSVLQKTEIPADIVVSIDGQNVSYNHFLHNVTEKSNINSTAFFFDLCANSSAAHKIYESGSLIEFFCSGHPLASAVNSFSHNTFPVIFSGSGTVTISALDLAAKLGFENIIILGADFSYSDNKAYANGSYLENLYGKDSQKLISAEKKFSALMYRTELIKISDKASTTQILEAYRFSMEKYLSDNQLSFTKDKQKYYITNKNHENLFENKISKKSDFSYSKFIEAIKNSSIEELEVPLLPYIAYLRKDEKNTGKTYNELLQLAFSHIVSYNI